MEWGGATKLGRQRSCAYPTPAVLDVGSWYSRSGRHRSLGLSRRYTADADGYDFDGDEDGELVPLEYYAGGRGEHAAVARAVAEDREGEEEDLQGAAVRVAYDPLTYALNFEERGSTEEMEPENLSRSFSARFANPSGVLRRFA